MNPYSEAQSLLIRARELMDGAGDTLVAAQIELPLESLDRRLEAEAGDVARGRSSRPLARAPRSGRAGT